MEQIGRSGRIQPLGERSRVFQQPAREPDLHGRRLTVRAVARPYRPGAVGQQGSRKRRTRLTHRGVRVRGAARGQVCEANQPSLNRLRAPRYAPRRIGAGVDNAQPVQQDRGRLRYD